MVKILPPLLNRYTRHNNVHRWARGPAKPPCRLFNIYADMYKKQMQQSRTRNHPPSLPPQKKNNQQVEKAQGILYPRPRQWCNPWGFSVC